MPKRSKKKKINMATAMNIPAIEPFVFDDSESLNLSRKWKTYKDEFQLYILASSKNLCQRHAKNWLSVTAIPKKYVESAASV